MSGFVDLTGQKFGSLIVVRRVENNRNKGAKWECLCECGKRIYVESANLKRIKSCGCKRRPGMKPTDLMGRRYNELTVITDNGRYMQESGRTVRVLLCKCDCGNLIDVDFNSLRCGHIKRCGTCQLAVKSMLGTMIIDKVREADVFQGTRIGGIKPDRKINKNNSSGKTGVHRNQFGRYEAYITLHRKKKYLGSYDFEKDAIKARQIAEEQIFQPVIDEYNQQRATV